MFHVVFTEVSVQFSCIDGCYLIVTFLGLVKFISGSQNLKSACLKEGFFVSLVYGAVYSTMF